jgi:hypothetical protein
MDGQLCHVAVAGECGQHVLMAQVLLHALTLRESGKFVLPTWLASSESCGV